MEQCAHDYRTAALPAAVRALCDYAVKLTHTPTAVGAGDVEELRRHGWEDEAIHDAIQVIAYFNYINRIAEAVGIGPEPEWVQQAERGQEER